MNQFLQQITRAKEAEVKKARARISGRELRSQLADMPACRDFGGALGGPGTRIIAEVKRCSPSVPAYLQTGAPAAIAGVYEKSGAAALSLVTDSARFGTSAVEIRPMRRVSSLPLIAKDFVIDLYQILALRRAGADAILLIARLLDDSRLAEFHGLASECGLQILVECHDQADVDRAVQAGAGLIGINNRDLDTFTVSLDTCRRLLPNLPPTCLHIVESGIQNRDQIAELESCGADAFLIGGALLQDPAPAERLRNFLGLEPEAEAS
jgi:indole-3-glycerol phosphate synthase